MRNLKGQFIDGANGKATAYKPNDARLIGNTYRKGLIPVNAFPVGHVSANFIGEIPRIISTSRDGKYRVITINEKVKRLNHKGKEIFVKKRVNFARYLYEKNFKKLPKNWVVVHLDRDFLNDELDNLQAMSRKDFIGWNKNKEI